MDAPQKKKSAGGCSLIGRVPYHYLGMDSPAAAKKGPGHSSF